MSEAEVKGDGVAEIEQLQSEIDGYARTLDDQAKEIKRLQRDLPCGHPVGCVCGDVTQYCGWCADEATLKRLASYNAKLRAVAEEVIQLYKDVPELLPMRGKIKHNLREAGMLEGE